MPNKKIILGTRNSPLALAQTNLVINEIKRYNNNIECEIVEIVTSGDLITDRNLYDLGGKALFLKELEIALMDGLIDIAIHSLKDVPGRLPPGLVIASVLERDDVRDALISLKYSSIANLPLNAKIGCSSVRRQVFLKQKRPDLEITMFRGNVNSRLKKLMENQVDGTILAVAGLKRLGLFNPDYCHIIQPEDMLPAVGQGVIALEARDDNIKALEICANINHLPTWDLIQAERAFLEYLDADCKTPLAAYSKYVQNCSDAADKQMVVDFMIADKNGKIYFHHEAGPVKDARQLGLNAGRSLSAPFSNI